MTQSGQRERLRPFKPTRFGRYTLLLPVATGGMGEVYLAHLEGGGGFEKLCVIKKVLPHLAAEEEFTRRFLDEGRILVHLHHGAVAQVLDMGVVDGAPYLALEFVDGKDLRRVLARARERREPLPLSFSLVVTVRLLDALAYAHRKRGEDDRELNLVHRDVSPQNVLVSYEGETKVIDFGLAKSTLSETRTSPGTMLGKFRYMSPEQARRQPVDRRGDLYAVGLVLYELLSGESPFEGVPVGELMERVASAVFRPLSQVAPACPPALLEVVARALAPEPARRFQSAEELRGRLQAILLELDPAAGPETVSQHMHALFAAEYAAERRQLQTLREQARALSPDEDAPLDGDTAIPLPPEEPAPLSRSGRFAPLPAPAAPRTLARATDELPTEAAAPIITLPEEPAPAMPAVTLDEVPAARPREVRASRAALPRAPANRGSGLRPAVKPARPVPEAPRTTDEVESPPAPPAMTNRSPAPPSKSGSALVWIVVPVVALLAVGGYIAWDVFSERLRAAQVEAQGAQRDEAPPTDVEPRKSREVKAPVPTPAPPGPTTPVAAPEDEELAPAAVVKKPKATPPPGPAPKPAPTAQQSPGARAFKALKAEFDAVTNGALAKKYRLRVNALGDKVDARGEDPGFVKDVEALRSQLANDAQKPEYQ